MGTSPLIHIESLARLLDLPSLHRRLAALEHVQIFGRKERLFNSWILPIFGAAANPTVSWTTRMFEIYQIGKNPSAVLLFTTRGPQRKVDYEDFAAPVRGMPNLVLTIRIQRILVRLQNVRCQRHA